MTRARSSSAKRSDSGQGNIKNFFGKKAGGEDAGAKEAAEVAANGDAAEPKAKSPGQSPGKTSDYESEASRSATPSGQASPGEETGSKPAENESQSADAGLEKTAADPRQGSPVVVKREIKTEEEDGDDEGADVFSQATAGADEEGEEEVEDESKVKAALQTGLLGKEVAEEERRMAAESRRLAVQEEARKKQELVKEAEEMSTKQRFERLQKLLGKSKFYTDFLLKKMQSHEAAMDLKNKTKVERARKRAEKEKQEGKQTSEEAPSEATKKRGRSGRKKSGDEDDDEEERKAKKARLEKGDSDRKFEGKAIPENQPLLLTGGIMRSYQLEGYEWMSTLWENGINGILADEMGLGKTIQTVALFCHMYEMGVPGPFMVVAPLSTVPNWVNEFKRFAPKVPCLLYHGNQQERAVLREKLEDTVKCEELDGKEMMQVVVTSYEIAMNDRSTFQNIQWRYIVVDEGHRLKNMNCRLIKELKQYHSANRLLLTGTPLQNNLSELWSLLNFLLPEIFDDLRVFESWFDAKDMHEDVEERKRVVAQEQQNSILTTLHQILTPFLLRRVKTDVDLQIPPKKEVLVYCPLTQRQKDLYRHIVEKTIEDFLTTEEEREPEALPEKRKKAHVDYSAFLDDKEYADDDKFEAHITKLNEYTEKIKGSGGSAYAKVMDKLKAGKEKNFSVKSRMMDMRKAVNHPYLIEYPISDCGTFYDTTDDMIDICGKLAVLHQMLTKLNENGHKTLIFSQMTKMLDILGDYLNLKKIKFCRLDGSMQFMDRQENIDTFNKDPEHKVFLLSTRAGGLGINLTAADTCIIYDSDWNPQQDLQAQDRCHRIGQTKPVMIYRLVSANTIDQKIVERAAAKRKLEKMIIHKEKFKSGAASIATSLKTLSPTELLGLLDSKDHVGVVSAEALASGKVFTDEQMEQLLDRSDLAWGDNPHNPANKAVSKVEGVFTVIDQDLDKKGDLGSVKE